MFTGHERWIDRMYGHGQGSISDSHRGYMNFGLWDDATPDYATAAENMVARLGALLELAPGARVLDAACGRGVQDVFLLGRHGAIAIDALDITRRNVELARELSAPGPGEVRFHHASATRLPFDDGHFTHVLCVEAAHHFDTREAYVREAYRVLVPGGRIALADIVMRRPPRTRTERALVGTATALWRIPRANMVTLDGYRAMLERVGFRVRSIEEVGARTFPGYYAAQRTPARRRELIAARGRLGATVGAVMNFAAHRVYRAGLLDYLLVSAVKPNSAHGAKRHAGREADGGPAKQVQDEPSEVRNSAHGAKRHAGREADGGPAKQVQDEPSEVRNTGGGDEGG
jgi:microcystin synthetase protein McyJ